MRIKVLSTKKYVGDLSKEIAQGKKRIFIQVMLFEPGKTVDKILLGFEKTDKKVKKKVFIDWLSLLFKNSKEYQERKEKLYVQLAALGIRVEFKNKPFILEKLFPYRKRNHIKVSVIDNVSYIGGVNLWDKEPEIDFMVKIESKKLSEFLARAIGKDFQKDIEFKVDNALSVVIDAGRMGKSLILQKVIGEAKKAKKEILFMNQFPPDGKLLSVYNNFYKNGGRVEGIIPGKNDFGFPLSTISLFNQLYLKLRRTSFEIHNSKKMVHAKLIIIDRKMAIFGSHNFTSKGVWMGTNEITGFTTDKKLVKELFFFYNKYR